MTNQHLGRSLARIENREAILLSLGSAALASVALPFAEAAISWSGGPAGGEGRCYG